MTNRERFRATMAFEKTDEPCLVAQGFWPETYEKWRAEEGLPGNIKEPAFEYLGEQPDLFSYFDVIRFGYLLPKQYYLPLFEEEIIEETDTYRVIHDTFGRTTKHSKIGASIPQFLDYPVKNRRDYEAIKERLQPKVAERYPPDWDRIASEMRNQEDVVIATHMDGSFGHPRELMGLENFVMSIYDDPDLIRDMINDRVEFNIEVYEKAIADTRPDMAFIWEDMCFTNGPLLSPALFREFMLPAYQKLTDFLRNMGVENILVDSDGDVRQLIPLWLEGGVAGVLPFEVKAGMDVVKIAEEFPTLRILGGIDKHVLERTKDEIDVELDRVLPAMLKRGGYLVSLDHWVQPEIPMENFRYFVERVREY